MKPTLRKTFLIRLFLVKLFDLTCRLIKWRKLENTIKNYMKKKSGDFFFVQIGANDGIIYDPIHRFVKHYRWRGVLVEPIQCYFNQLKLNYADNPGLVFENCAISDKQEVKDFYRVKEGLDFLPVWCNGLGTFHLDVVMTHKWAIPNLADYLVKEQVDCITLNTLLEKHSICHIDLLLIDTEGHDYAIIRQINFDQIRPQIIVYEHQYIGKTDQRKCESMLSNYGYKLAKHMGNTMAYSN